MRLNLLTEALIGVAGTTGPAMVSLSALYAALMADEIDCVTAVRPHQRKALHSALCSIGALALLEAQLAEPPHTADAWAKLLRNLTPGFEHDEPWCLVVDDLSKPAFLQPPVPEGSLAALKEQELTPDGLDMLVTSKNHDLKAARMTSGSPEAWLFALLTLQTSQGIYGRGQYGISRMFTGSGSRPFVGLAPEGQWGAHIKRDIMRLIERRSYVFESNPMYGESGRIGLVWLEPWDGNTQLQPNELDPYFVEICRRIRLKSNGAQIIAHRGSSTKPRLNIPSSLNGMTGDPWTPIDRSGPKALTMGGSGFHYRRVVDLLDAEKFTPALLQQPSDADSRRMELVWLCSD